MFHRTPYKYMYLFNCTYIMLYFFSHFCLIFTLFMYINQTKCDTSVVNDLLIEPLFNIDLTIKYLSDYYVYTLYTHVYNYTYVTFVICTLYKYIIILNYIVMRGNKVIYRIDINKYCGI